MLKEIIVNVEDLSNSLNKVKKNKNDYCRVCIIAEAIGRTFNYKLDCSVSFSFVHFKSYHNISLPMEAKRILNEFDLALSLYQYDEVERRIARMLPETFTLNIPDEVLAEL